MRQRRKKLGKFFQADAGSSENRIGAIAQKRALIYFPAHSLSKKPVF